MTHASGDHAVIEVKLEQASKYLPLSYPAVPCLPAALRQPGSPGGPGGATAGCVRDRYERCDLARLRPAARSVVSDLSDAAPHRPVQFHTRRVRGAAGPFCPLP